MSRISQVTEQEASEELKLIQEQIKKKMGRIPNIFLHMGHSPAALKGYLATSEIAGKTSLPPKLREEIALVVAESNQCHYCLSAHSAIAKMQGLSEQQINMARKGSSGDPKESAILHFAKQIVEKRGKVSAQEVEEVKKSGVSEKEIVEIIFLVTTDMFTNYFNLIVDPQNDFPEAQPLV